MFLVWQKNVPDRKYKILYQNIFTFHFTSHLTDLQKAASVTISYKNNIYFMLEIEVEFMFYKIHTYTKTSGINKWLTAASPTPMIISKVTCRSPSILLSENAIQSARTQNKFYYSACLEEPCTVRSVGCVGSANTFSTKLNSVALVRERTIPTERPPSVGEVSANFCG